MKTAMILRPHHDQALRIIVRKRRQYDALEYTEDQRIRPYAERQRENGDRRKALVFEQRPDAVTQVLKHLVLHSLRLQYQRIPECARAAPQQFKFVPPIESVPFGQ